MTETIRNWILSLGGAAVLGALALAITPEGPVRSVVRMLCGVVMALALISPLLRMDMDTYSLSLAEYREKVAGLTGSLEDTRDRLRRTIIEEECAAYIWDKAQELGIQAGQAEVAVKWGDDCWVPWEAHMRFAVSGSQRSALSYILEAELGIPAERQYWNEEH